MDHFDSCGVFLSIAINIHVLLTTAFVLQGHVYALEGLVNDALRNISELLHPLIQWNIKRDLFTQYFPNCPTVQQKTPRVHQLPSRAEREGHAERLRRRPNPEQKHTYPLSLQAQGGGRAARQTLVPLTGPGLGRSLHKTAL